tara:strand:+ start:531 stop:878 length:348 start_codon:yes stop_codon:yes gene_type:complete
MSDFMSNLELLMLCEASRSNKHMCMDGSFVDCFSLECADDIRHRISDAIHSRDSCKTQTDARSYYNGILRVMRRQLREVEKEIQKRQLSESATRTKRRKLSKDQSNRMLKLSGLI